jgi:hypothetical protein
MNDVAPINILKSKIHRLSKCVHFYTQNCLFSTFNFINPVRNKTILALPCSLTSQHVSQQDFKGILEVLPSDIISAVEKLLIGRDWLNFSRSCKTILHNSNKKIPETVLFSNRILGSVSEKEVLYNDLIIALYFFISCPEYSKILKNHIIDYYQNVLKTKFTNPFPDENLNLFMIMTFKIMEMFGVGSDYEKEDLTELCVEGLLKSRVLELPFYTANYVFVSRYLKDKKIIYLNEMRESSSVWVRFLNMKDKIDSNLNVNPNLELSPHMMLCIEKFRDQDPGVYLEIARIYSLSNPALSKKYILKYIQLSQRLNEDFAFVLNCVYPPATPWFSLVLAHYSNDDTFLKGIKEMSLEDILKGDLLLDCLTYSVGIDFSNLQTNEDKFKAIWLRLRDRLPLYRGKCSDTQKMQLLFLASLNNQDHAFKMLKMLGLKGQEYCEALLVVLEKDDEVPKKFH